MSWELSRLHSSRQNLLRGIFVATRNSFLSRGKKPGFARKESVKSQLEKKIAAKKEKTQLNNFYKFQIKESKMKSK